MSGISKLEQPFNLHTTISPLPRNPTKALQNLDWNSALLDEFRVIINNKTWELVPWNSGMNIVTRMWILCHKTQPYGSLERYKEHLVCDGRSQQVRVDCGETLSLVIKLTTIHTVLSILLSRSWPIHQLDVKNTFFHGNLHKTVCMHQPMGFHDTQFPIMCVC